MDLRTLVGADAAVLDDCDFRVVLLASVSSPLGSSVVSALDARGTPVGVGEVREGVGVYVDGDRVDPPSEDASWGVYERLSRRMRSG